MSDFVEYKPPSGLKMEKGSALISASWASLLRYHTIPKKRVHLGNTSIYRSQQGVISDSPSTTFERLGEVSRFSFSHFLQNFVTDGHTHHPKKGNQEEPEIASTPFGFVTPINVDPKHYFDFLKSSCLI